MLVALTAHTPYNQWKVYRQRHLLILTNRLDRGSFELGQRVADVLAAELPASRAEMTRAPHWARVASLITTDQMDVALMTRPGAAALMAGDAPFADYGPFPLRALVGIGEYLLVCRANFPERHAYLVAGTLSDHRAQLPVALSPDGAGNTAADATVPTHPGAIAFFSGQPEPARRAQGADED
jgi:TRAP-type uncharacterized transport system substrate-binding protein